MGRAVGQQHLVHDEHAVLLGGVGIDRDGFEDAIGAVPLGLTGRAAVKSPVREFFQVGKLSKSLTRVLPRRLGTGV
jgi:hypothetical protein